MQQNTTKAECLPYQSNEGGEEIICQVQKKEHNAINIIIIYFLCKHFIRSLSLVAFRNSPIVTQCLSISNRYMIIGKYLV